MSAKDETQAVYASLFFQIAHYCIRPWPWILVGLAALILYPDLPLEESRKGFVYAMRDHLPSGLKGLLFVGFISAYMSTISTQLNWGSSYLTNDLYKRFIKRKESDRHYVGAGRIITLLIMLVAMFATSQIKMIDTAAQFLIASGAGLGMVLILRWYWWRINAWSELSATIAPLLAWGLLKYPLKAYLPESFYHQNGDFIATVVFTSIVWLTVTFLTPPTETKVLQAFYQRIKPQGWWAPFVIEGEAPRPTASLFGAWLSGVALVYTTLFSIGEWLLGDNDVALMWTAGFFISIFSIRFFMKRGDFFAS
jgi:SSS family solute:Na+ symporter